MSPALHIGLLAGGCGSAVCLPGLTRVCRLYCAALLDKKLYVGITTHAPCCQAVVPTRIGCGGRCLFCMCISTPPLLVNLHSQVCSAHAPFACIPVPGSSGDSSIGQKASSSSHKPVCATYLGGSAISRWWQLVTGMCWLLQPPMRAASCPHSCMLDGIRHGQCACAGCTGCTGFMCHQLCLAVPTWPTVLAAHALCFLLRTD